MLLVQIHGKYQQDYSWETKLPRSVLKIRMLFSVVQLGGGDGVKNGRGKHRISAAGCASMRRVVFSIKASRLTLDNLRTPDIHHEVKSATNRVAQRFP